MPQKLRVVSAALRSAELQLAGSISALRTRGDDAACDSLERLRDMLTQLAGDVAAHADAVEDIDRTVSDRMNNFLMMVQTVSDRLRDTVPAEIRDHLRMTVEHGRASVSSIRKALATL